MRIYQDIPLSEFNFWGEGLKVAKQLADDEWEAVEARLEDVADEWTAEGVNDAFANAKDVIEDAIGRKLE